MSGSTAWSNSVRSRLYLHRPDGVSIDGDDDDARILEVMKANYGPIGQRFELRWCDGRFIRTEHKNPWDRVAVPDVELVKEKFASGRWRVNEQSGEWGGYAVAEVLDWDVGQRRRGERADEGAKPQPFACANLPRRMAQEQVNLHCQWCRRLSQAHTVLQSQRGPRMNLRDLKYLVPQWSRSRCRNPEPGVRGTPYLPIGRGFRTAGSRTAGSASLSAAASIPPEPIVEGEKAPLCAESAPAPAARAPVVVPIDLQPKPLKRGGSTPVLPVTGGGHPAGTPYISTT